MPYYLARVDATSARQIKTRETLIVVVHLRNRRRVFEARCAGLRHGGSASSLLSGFHFIPQFHFTLLYFTLLYFILLHILISVLYFILFYFTSFILELWIQKIRPQITAIMACCNTQMARHHFILLYFTLHYSCGALLHIISFGLH